MGALLDLPSTGITTRSTSSGAGGQLDMVFNVEDQHLAAVRRIVREHCRLWLIDEETSERLVIAVNELVTNVLVHTAPDTSKKRPTSLLVQQVPGGITAVVSDHDPQPPRHVISKTDDESGRGWALVQRLVDESSVSPTELGKDVWVFLSTPEVAP